MNSIYLKYILIFSYVLVLSGHLLAQQLPFRLYTTADGLPSNETRKIYQDKRGYIWFATNEGLSRFDGYNFVNYDDRDGLGSKRINDVLEDEQGRLWAANNGNGVSLKIDRNFTLENGKSLNQKFKTFPVGATEASNRVNRILIDSRNILWCLTDDGFFRAPLADDLKFELIYAYKSPVEYKSRLLFEAQNGHVWFAVEREFFEVVEERVVLRGEMPVNLDVGISQGFQDRHGRLLILSNNDGPFELIPPNGERLIPQWRKLMTDLHNTVNFRFIMQDDRGRIWFAGWGGIFKFADETLQKVEIQEFDTLDAISMMQDREGNLWIGTGTGVRRLSDESLISFVSIEDVEFPHIKWLNEENGKFKLGFIDQRQKYIEKYRKAELSENQLKFGNFDARISSNNGNYSVLQQPNQWKDGVDFPVARPVLQLRSGKEIDAAEFLDQPLENESFMSLYEDEKGFLWVVKNDEFLHRADPNKFSAEKPENFPCGISGKDGNSAMMTDFNGGIWLFASAIKRFRNDRCEFLEGNQRLNESGARRGFYDSRGWFWIITDNDGVAVTENQSANQPIFKFYTDADGLLSQTVRHITEDAQGRMYFGTPRGLSRFDPKTGQWESFTSKSGLPSDEIRGIYKDSVANIWILTLRGLSKLNPNLERKNNLPPPIYISRVNVAGEDLPFSESEISENPAIEIDSSRNNLTVDYVGLQFRGEDALNYQHILEGVDADWSKPNKNRTITFANLGSGNYRFLVRAVNQEGLTSASPAAFQFRILPPLYLRWWFIGSLLLLVGAIIYAFYRSRLQKLLEIERTRTLIATDLHDDIGSNLSKISVLSEVVRMQLNSENNEQNRLLNSIAETSRRSVSSMSDIVWAINPKRDSVLEMTRKMREHAEEIFVPRKVRVEFFEPERGANVKLPMDLRRDIYLVFKEAINNVAKHSNCAGVKINFQIKNREITLEIEDDGDGFIENSATGGNGLANMQSRVEKLNGSFQIEPRINLGTLVRIRIPQN
ncbi:MAG: histidine kinase [Acidobacteriota bacterium]|nr:histidine kinase [Acidobacteriota bacterium]